jgi:hypothetical protein
LENAPSADAANPQLADVGPAKMLEIFQNAGVYPK